MAATESSARWRLWIDTGGTFTDCLALDPGGRLHRAKVLSSGALRAAIVDVLGGDLVRLGHDWDSRADVISGMELRVFGGAPSSRITSFDPETRIARLEESIRADPGVACEIGGGEEAPVLAARLVTGTSAGEPLPPLDVRLGTTRGTNALLERRGAPTAFFVTEGFGDLLLIGNQQRPELFALRVEKPPPLYSASLEVTGRLAAGGSELRPFDEAALRSAARSAVRGGIRSAAVALMHAYADPRHEQAVRDVLLEEGFEHVSLSSDLAPFVGLLARAQTATVDAYLGPVVAAYLDEVRESIGARARFHVMTSAGGLVRADSFRAKDSLLSGPAGGVVGAAMAGRRSGFERVIAFDMGGTSTDVARIDGDFEYVFEHEVAGARVVAPALAIESVAAGGGSICTYDAQGLRVGPESAGASPGPACYGAGGPLTLTDVNLLLGRLDGARFSIPIDEDAVFAAADEMLARVGRPSGGREALLEGLVAIADERMADAIRSISVRRGYDPAIYALVAFGGAGGQHACGIAERLGVETVIVPPDAGLLSATGIGHAVMERFAERQVLRRLDEVEDRLPDLLRALESEATESVAEEGVPVEDVLVRRRIAGMRYAGQDAVLAVDWDGRSPLRDLFEERYEAVYGHRPDNRPVELESLRVVASERPDDEPVAVQPAVASARPVGWRRAWVAGGWRNVPVYERDRLAAGAHLQGPALVTERHSAALLMPGWGAYVDGAGALVMEHLETMQEATRQTPETVRRELFVNRFRAIASEMGEMLRRTALSTNVKERLDFSCALLDAEGRLVVNAPHIPVHLGALGLCVRSVCDALPMRPGDVAVTNHPAFGGSHLPDVTVITPVHDDEARLVGYVASRAHHAEIGGARPGSMPPAAKSLAEEGVVIPPMLLVRDGRAEWEAMRRILSSGPYPSRAVEENLADLAAAVAANHRGAGLLRGLADEHGLGAVSRYMDALRRRAADGVREALQSLGEGAFEAEENLDDGSPLRVRIEVKDGRAVIDFSGSAAVHPGNLNATPTVVRSVVLYVLRLLVQEPLPLNEGMMEPVELVIPPGILDPPFGDDPARDPAVVGGNTEVSQRLTDTLIKALGMAACSQGTMNNVLWGTERFGYYETVCGGSGAVPDGPGADAVHVHMTNTRITDPEVIEARYPVRVERFAVRRGSGGAGRFRGGDGAVREVTFLEPMSLSVLTQHRAAGPYGIDGGEAGAPGLQRLVRASGEVITLGSIDGCEVEAGDRLVLETPGGGGWGPPEGRP